MKEVCQDRRADLGGTELEMNGNERRGIKVKRKLWVRSYTYCMDKSKHTRLSYTEEKNLPNQVNNPFFKHNDELNANIYEVEKRKKVLLDLPSQIGFAMYSYAKLQLIQFWEFINTFLINNLYQLM